MLQRKRCSSTCAEIVANIEELLTEILLRVPATPLLRFKRVSKRWLSLISNPTFFHRHTLQNPHSSISAVLSDSSEKFSFIPFPPPDHDLSGNNDRSSPRWNPLNVIAHQYGCIRIIHSCNGLFLCQPFVATTTSRSPYFVLNPTTNKFSTLAIPPCPAAAIVHGQQVETHIIGCSLAFDPSRSSHYKVICLDTIDGSISCRNYQIQIYSSETRSWRLLSSSINRHTSVFYKSYNQGVYCNGAIHWLGDYCEILYYHIDEESVEFVETTPHCLQKKWWSVDRCLMESSGGRLHLIDYDSCLTKLEVLEMGRDYSGWFVKYNVDLEPLRTTYPDFNYGDYVVLFLDRDDNEQKDDNLSLMLHTPGKVISCNLKSKTLKSFELATDQCYLVSDRNFLYKETLACV